MADTKISALSETLVPSFDDVFPVVVGAATMKAKRRNFHATKRTISEYSNSLATALSTISTTPTTLVITSDITVSTATVPATITLEFAMGGKLTVTTGQTLTILGDIVAGERKIFDNILSGQGTISFANNQFITRFYAAWWGVVSDGSTDCTAILQRIIDTLYAQLVEGVIVLPKSIEGEEIIIAGALQDTSLSNSQIVLPKSETEQYSLTIEGQGLPSFLVSGSSTSGTEHAGSILKSTLNTGSGGSVIGVKTSATLGVSRLNLFFKDVTILCPPNPPHSALDLRFIAQARWENLKITTGAAFDLFTEPTTTTSVGIQTPNDFIPATCTGENMAIYGFYTGIRWGELARLDNVTIGFCKEAIRFIAFPHLAHGSRILVINCTHVLMFTNTPDFQGGTNTPINLDMDIERATLTNYPANPWFVGVDEISDVGNYGTGSIKYRLILPPGAPSTPLVIPSGHASRLDVFETSKVRTMTIAGAPIVDYQTVIGQATLDGTGAVTVTLTGDARFKSAADYNVSFSNLTAARMLFVNKISGTQFAFAGTTPGDIVDFTVTGRAIR